MQKEEDTRTGLKLTGAFIGRGEKADVVRPLILLKMKSALLELFTDMTLYKK